MKATNENQQYTAFAVLDPGTGKSLNNKQLMMYPTLKKIWLHAMYLELGRLSQGYKGNAGANTIYFITHEE